MSTPSKEEITRIKIARAKRTHPEIVKEYAVFAKEFIAATQTILDF